MVVAVAERDMKRHVKASQIHARLAENEGSTVVDVENWKAR